MALQAIALPPVGGCDPATHASADRFVPDGADSGDVAWDRDWRIAGGSEFAEETVLDVAAFNDGFVAAGRRSVGGRTNAFLLRSGDGVRWTGDASGAGFPKTELSALAVAGERLFAIGSTNVDDRGGSRAAVWFSDDGTSWSEATGPFDESHVTALAGRTADLLLAGAAARTGELITWCSRGVDQRVQLGPRGWPGGRWHRDRGRWQRLCCSPRRAAPGAPWTARAGSRSSVGRTGPAPSARRTRSR